MKLIKVINLLNDVDNWTIDTFNGEKCVHTPTGVYFISGVAIYNFRGSEIYSSFFAWFFILPFFVNRIKKRLKKQQPDTLEKIYDQWLIKKNA